jgi:hypothetical protein
MDYDREPELNRLIIACDVAPPVKPEEGPFNANRSATHRGNRCPREVRGAIVIPATSQADRLSTSDPLLAAAARAIGIC